MNALRKKHNRVKRRIELGASKAGDKDKLIKLRAALGYDKR